MRNITVSVDEKTYRRARVAASEVGTSVSTLVNKPASNEAKTEGLKREEYKLSVEIAAFSARDRLVDRFSHFLTILWRKSVYFQLKGLADLA